MIEETGSREARTPVSKGIEYILYYFLDVVGVICHTPRHLLPSARDSTGKSIIGVMTLAAEPGLELTLEFDGQDEEAAADDIVDYFERGFKEE